jgi:hypothetical protein
VKGWKSILRKWSPRASRSSYIHIWQSRFQTKISQKRQRSLLHIDKGNNLAGNITVKNIYTVHMDWYIQFHKANTTGHTNTDKSQQNNSKCLQ